MIRLLSTLLLLIVSCNLSFASFPSVRTDIAIDGLKGNVKSVKTYKIRKLKYYHVDTIAKYERLNMPLPEYEKDLYTEDHYNAQGQKTYNRDYWRINYFTFDPYNKMPFCHSKEVSYDADDGSLRRVYEFTFDSNHLPVSAIAVDGNGDVIFTESYTSTIFPDGKIEINCIHTSASLFGQDTESSCVFRSDLSLEKITQKTSDSFLLTETNEQEQPYRMVMINDGVETVYTIEYDADANTERAYQTDEAGAKTLLSMTVKDANGNPVSTIRYNQQGEIEKSVTIAYEYDAQGNWVRRVKITKSNVPDEGLGIFSGIDSDEPDITERVIEYY